MPSLKDNADDRGDIRTASIENFLKTVYRLQQVEERVRTSSIAEAMNITAPSAYDFINRCQEATLIDYISHRGVRLTEEGEKIALEVLRHHRLIELYLVQALGYSWDEVHEEAERLEHHISEKLEARIADYLGNPQFDPHGDPIPDVDGSLPQRGLISLLEMPVGEAGSISRLLNQSPEHLRYLDSKGLVLGANILITDRETLDRLTHLKVEGIAQVVGEAVARHIMIQRPS